MARGKSHTMARHHSTGVLVGQDLVLLAEVPQRAGGLGELAGGHGPRVPAARAGVTPIADVK